MRRRAPSRAEGDRSFVPASSDGLFARAAAAQVSQAHWPGELDDLLEGQKPLLTYARNSYPDDASVVPDQGVLCLGSRLTSSQRDACEQALGH